MRIGQGFDIHRMAPNLPLIIGGVNIPFQKGLVGHSDADVLLHAICDALLGAAGLRDIGYHFPNTDKRLSGFSSRKILVEVKDKVKSKGHKISNIDCTVIAQEPMLSKFIPIMIENIARDLDLDLDQVNVKAKTSEKLGCIGRGEGIAAEAICLII